MAGSRYRWGAGAGYRALWLVLLAAAFGWSGDSHAASRPTVTLEVDAREAVRGIERAHLSIPVKPGPLTLLYPKWPPGDHAPSGPIASLGGLRFSADGRSLPWQRDALNMYAFHVAVPARTTRLEVDLEVTSAVEPAGLSAPRTSTNSLAIIAWHTLVLYPAGTATADIDYAASLVMPAGWQVATALRPVTASVAEQTSVNRASFAAESLTTLVDSTALIGRHMRTIELGGDPAVYLHFAADTDAALAISTESVDRYRELVRQARELFGGSHYRGYHFLWALTDHVAPDGIEHHESSDNRSPERSVVDDDLRRSQATLLVHEYVHSWNGKYRRPADLVTRDLNEPIRTGLLWVYEGLTEYLQEVLAARSGLLTTEEHREDWATIAADMESHRGREWRSLQDVALAAQLEYDQTKDWTARTRGTDFYSESALLWLEADVTIRRESGGRRSLDDFCRAFFGGVSGAPEVRSYDEDDVFAALAAVQPHDWKGFWRERLTRVRAHAPLEGLEESGWRLSFTGEPSLMQRAYDAQGKQTDLRYSLGFIVADEAVAIKDVVPGSPADIAGVSPGSTLAGLEGRKWSKEVLQDVLAGHVAHAGHVGLLVEKDGDLVPIDLSYGAGERIPRLERNQARPDLLTRIAQPRS